MNLSLSVASVCDRRSHHRRSQRRRYKVHGCKARKKFGVISPRSGRGEGRGEEFLSALFQLSAMCLANLLGLHRWTVLLLVFLSAASAFAHDLNTSYTKINISRDQFVFQFTFDVTTLLKVVDLDENKDFQVTSEELARNAPAIRDFLKRRIRFEMDAKPADFGAEEPLAFAENVPVVAEKDYHQMLIRCVFRKTVEKMPEEFTLVYDIFETLGERHVNLASIEEGLERYDEIVFTKAEPGCTYFTTTPPSLRSQLAQFLKLGVKHIFLGYDHILFLLALIVVSRFWELVKIITAFTVAHTITLILAALEIVTLPSRWIETGIAVTIMYVALENLWVKKTRHRWVLTFGFGLVHGFGFANVLSDLGLPTQGLVRSLVSFNVGVELGQIAIVLALLPLVIGLDKWRFGARAKVVLSVVIFLFGLAWFIERAFGLRFMPI
jgi:energy-converting hydrogenase Eha subunit E